MLRVTNPTVTLSVGVTVRVVRNGDYGDFTYPSITNDDNMYA